MALTEFSLIEKYFSALGSPRADVLLGIGDDAAQLLLAPDMSLVVSIDTMVCGIHFPENTSAADIGYKLLAVNLSDMAAMGAEPTWITLALTLPNTDEAWLKAFSTGLGELALQSGVQLVGGDTTKGPMVLSLQAHGVVPNSEALKRSGAQVGDDIYVSGTLGDAALGLKVALEGTEYIDSDYLLQRLNRPTPRVTLGLALRNIAHSAIDISDGLIADLTHICEKSSVSMQLELSKIPLSTAYQNAGIGYIAAVTGGDDYELCFTAAVDKKQAIQQLSKQLELPIHCIGKVTSGNGGVNCRLNGQPHQITEHGYQHFTP